MAAAGFRFDFVADWRHAPLAHWVHRAIDPATGRYEPAAPAAVPHRGYPLLRVSFGVDELVFSSAAQLLHCIDVLARSSLPTTRRLSADRASGAGPNGHWLSRLPARLKAPKARARLVDSLRSIAELVLVPERTSFRFDLLKIDALH